MKLPTLIVALSAALMASCAVVQPRTVEPVAASALNAFDSAQAELRNPDSSHVMVVAHRACWRDGAPENSLSAIAACFSMGVDMVELDVHRTRDGALVLLHDETVDRTTNGVGLIEDLTLAEVKQLRLRSGAGGATAYLTNETIPTFEEAMLAVRGRMLVNLDAKDDVYADAFAILETTQTTDHILMKRRVKAIDPALTTIEPFSRVFTMPILDQMQGAPEPLIQAQGAGAPIAYELIFTDFGYLNTASPLIQKQSARIWVNTLAPNQTAGITDATALADPDTNWGRLVALGVDVIQTDEPRALIKYLHSKGHRRNS